MNMTQYPNADKINTDMNDMKTKSAMNQDAEIDSLS